MTVVAAVLISVEAAMGYRKRSLHPQLKDGCQQHEPMGHDVDSLAYETNEMGPKGISA